MAKVTREKKIMSRHLNPQGTLHGGMLIMWMDEVGAGVAHCHSEQYCVTAHVDNVNLSKRVYVGQIIVITAVVNRTWNTSMEIGVIVEVVDKETGQREIVTSGFYVYVAIDPENGEPTKIFEYVPSTEDERRRWREAQGRRRRRLSARERIDKK